MVRTVVRGLQSGSQSLRRVLVDRAWHRSGSEAAKLRKSCSPRKAAAAALQSCEIQVATSRDRRSARETAGRSDAPQARWEARGTRRSSRRPSVAREMLRNDLRFEDADRSGQSAVERANQIRRRNARLQREAGDLGQRVHAGVGAARSLRQRRFAHDAAQRGLQFALDRCVLRAASAIRGSRFRRRQRSVSSSAFVATRLE